MPTTHYYTLGAPSDSATVSAPTAEGLTQGLEIGVEPFSVDPPYDQDRVVYREGVGSAEVGFYNYHRWVASPGRLVQLALVEGLAGAPGIALVEPAASQTVYGGRLGGRVLYLEEVDRPSGAGGAEARVAIRFDLRDAEGETLWSETLSASSRSSRSSRSAAEPAQEAGRTVDLIRDAFDQVVTQARAGLSAALAR